MKKVFCVLFLAILSACQSIQPLPKAITVTPSAYAPTVATAIKTLSPAATATLTPEPTNSPDRPLSKSGPWIFVPLDKTFFAINPDGTGYTSFEHGTAGAATNPSLRVASVAAHGNMIAYVEEAQSQYEDPSATVLKLRVFPGDDKVVIPLAKNLKLSAFTTDAFNSETNEFKSAYDKYLDTAFAIGELAWSPDGKYIAFTGAIDGLTSDVYVYTLATGKIKRLTDAITQAIYLHWSPDSRYIVHSAATSLNIGRSGGGYDIDSIWVASPDGLEVRKLLDESGDIYGFGWIDPSKYLFGHFLTAMEPYASRLEIVDIATGQLTTWFDGSFEAGAYDPADKVFLLTVNSQDAGAEKYSDGLYLLTLGQSPKKISERMMSRWGAEWHPEIKRFLVMSNDGKVFSVTSAGQIEEQPFLHDLLNTSLSPDGKYWSVVEGEARNENSPGPYPYTFIIGDWTGKTWSVTTWNDYQLNSVKTWSPDSQYCYLSIPGKFIVSSLPDFKILRTISVDPGSFNEQDPIWINP